MKCFTARDQWIDIRLDRTTIDPFTQPTAGDQEVNVCLERTSINPFTQKYLGMKLLGVLEALESDASSLDKKDFKDVLQLQKFFEF